MKVKDFLIGAACGLAAGAITTAILTNQTLVSSEEVLHKIKKLLNEHGRITGSWIMTKPEIVERNSLSYRAYRGGITCIEDHTSVNYEFLADAKTGTVLELKEA